MLASIFIIQGLDAVLHPDRKVAAAEPVVRPLAERASFVPDDVEQAVRINGAVQLVAGSMLALGRFPRVSALAVAASLLPTTYAGHRFWETDDKQERTQQRIHFLKNVSMFGGLLIAAGDTAGNPSIAWRGRHALTSAKRDAALATKSAKAGAKAKTAKSRRQEQGQDGQGIGQGRRQGGPAGQTPARRLIPASVLPCGAGFPQHVRKAGADHGRAPIMGGRRSWEGAGQRAPGRGRRSWEGAGRMIGIRASAGEYRPPAAQGAFLRGGYWVIWGASALLRPRLRASAVCMSS